MIRGLGNMKFFWKFNFVADSTVFLHDKLIELGGHIQPLLSRRCLWSDDNLLHRELILLTFFFHGVFTDKNE